MNTFWNTPIDKLTFEMIQQFCGAGVEENIRIEYKREFSSDRPGFQIAKEISAFANTQGGTIIFGVEEDEKRKPKPPFDGFGLGKDPRQTVICALATIFPSPVADVSGFIINPTDSSRGFLVVKVPPSLEICALEERTGIYVRVHDQSVPKRPTPEQFELLLNRRRAAITAQEERRRVACERLKVAVGEHALEGCMCISIGPRLSIDRLLDRDELERYATECSAPTLTGRDWRPFNVGFQNADLHAVQDGVYVAEEEYAASLDVWGNLTTLDRLQVNMLLNDFSHRDELRIIGKRQLGEADESACFECIIVARIIGALITNAEFVRALYAARGFVGDVSCRVQFWSVGGVRLVRATETGLMTLGCMKLDNNIDHLREVETLRMQQSPADVVVTLFEDILWSWDCKNKDIVRSSRNDVAKAIDELERRRRERAT